MFKKINKPTSEGLIPKNSLSDILDFASIVESKKKWTPFLKHLRSLGYQVRSKRELNDLINRSAKAK